MGVEVAVGNGVLVAVGGKPVFVGVGGREVFVGVGVFVGGSAVLVGVGGSAVFVGVGGRDVLVGVGVGEVDPQPVNLKLPMRVRQLNEVEPLG